MATSIKELTEAGAHYGHQVSRRHPAFAPFLHGERKGIHIINPAFTLVELERSADYLREVVANGGNVLFVGTKPQASDIIREHAEKCGQFYVTFRWLGGFLTNFKTIRNSIKKMIAYEENEGQSGGLAMTKKERLKKRVEYDKMVRVLAGVRDMRKAPDAVVIVDVGHEAIAVHECSILGIPAVGIVDTNGDPTTVMYPVPGNDDSVRSLEIYLRELSQAILEGKDLQQERQEQGAREPVEETEFVLDKEEDLDEASLLARRKVYKVKKTITMKSSEETDAAPADDAEAAETTSEEAPAEEMPAKAAATEEKPAEEAPAEDKPAEEAAPEASEEKDSAE